MTTFIGILTPVMFSLAPPGYSGITITT